MKLRFITDRGHANLSRNGNSFSSAIKILRTQKKFPAVPGYQRTAINDTLDIQAPIIQIVGNMLWRNSRCSPGLNGKVAQSQHEKKGYNPGSLVTNNIRNQDPGTQQNDTGSPQEVARKFCTQVDTCNPGNQEGRLKA